MGNLHKEFFTDNSGFGILRLMALSNKWSASDLAYLFTADQLLRTVCLAHYHKQRHEKNIGELFSKSLRKTEDGDDHDNPVMLSYHT